LIVLLNKGRERKRKGKRAGIRNIGKEWERDGKDKREK